MLGHHMMNYVMISFWHACIFMFQKNIWVLIGKLQGLSKNTRVIKWALVNILMNLWVHKRKGVVDWLLASQEGLYFMKLVWAIKLRMRWTGHVACMWEDNIRMDLKETGWKVVDWIHLAQDWDHYWALVNTVMNVQVI